MAQSNITCSWKWTQLSMWPIDAGAHIFLWSPVLCRLYRSLSGVTISGGPLHVYTCKNITYTCKWSYSPCQSLVHYGNTCSVWILECLVQHVASTWCCFPHSSRATSRTTEKRLRYDGKEVVMVTLNTQTDWDWVENAQTTGKVKVLIPTEGQYWYAWFHGVCFLGWHLT